MKIYKNIDKISYAICDLKLNKNIWQEITKEQYEKEMKELEAKAQEEAEE